MKEEIPIMTAHFFVLNLLDTLTINTFSMHLVPIKSDYQLAVICNLNVHIKSDPSH